MFGVDPGGTTGYFWARVRADSKEPAHVLVDTAMSEEHVGFGQIKCSPNETLGVRRLMREIENTDTIWGVDVLAVEDFILRGAIKTTKREGLAPVRVIAAMQYALELSPVSAKVVMQSPSNAKGVITDTRLREWGLWLPGERHRHVRDAMRHCLLYLRGREA